MRGGRSSLAVLSLSAVVSIGLPPAAEACTNLLVTRGASADGSVMLTYTCDGEFHPRLNVEPAAEHAAGDSLEIVDWDGKSRGKIAEVPHTYAVVRLMNEHQLVIAETTFDGRKELEDPDGILHYWDLMQLALKRARTAREAIGVITSLVKEYGYRSTGESFSIGDPKEAWILEMIGRGPGGGGAVWAAVRVPDGMISCHANRSRIGTFPLDDAENCLYSPDVISFATERGYYDP
ncbi:MAG: dipeptidase, partial [Candidatus Latescibacterota bacterium]